MTQHHEFNESDFDMRGVLPPSPESLRDLDTVIESMFDYGRTSYTSIVQYSVTDELTGEVAIFSFDQTTKVDGFDPDVHDVGYSASANITNQGFVIPIDRATRDDDKAHAAGIVNNLQRTLPAEQAAWIGYIHQLVIGDLHVNPQVATYLLGTAPVQVNTRSITNLMFAKPDGTTIAGRLYKGDEPYLADLGSTPQCELRVASSSLSGYRYAAYVDGHRELATAHPEDLLHIGYVTPADVLDALRRTATQHSEIRQLGVNTPTEATVQAMTQALKGALVNE